MEELLWPEKRERDAMLGEKILGMIPRTMEPSTLRIPLPQGAVTVSIPAGTPVALLANVNLLSPKVPALLQRLRGKEAIANLVDALLEVSTCPDLVANRGHYFGTGLDGEPSLTDQQKRDLIEYLKTM